jgi:hypothetical protein
LSIPGGEQLARLDSPEKGRYLYAGPTSPDGSLIAVYVASKPEDPQEVRFLDARTLDKHGQILLGNPDPEQYGWGNGQFGLFTPDGPLRSEGCGSNPTSWTEVKSPWRTKANSYNRVQPILTFRSPQMVVVSGASWNPCGHMILCAGTSSDASWYFHVAGAGVREVFGVYAYPKFMRGGLQSLSAREFET